jgi:aryl-alcohol dehydrogenase-like predicted oxidoreductase
MAVLSEAREKGLIRTHGVSCHTLDALKTAAASPWVQVDLARINPAKVAMDSDPQTVVGVLKQMKASGKGVIGMKILGAGRLRAKPASASVCARARLRGLLHHRGREPRRDARPDPKIPRPVSADNST